MTDLPASAPPRRRRRWWRGLGWGMGLLAVFVVAAYLTVFSQGFLRKVVLPQLEAELDVAISVDEIVIRPFSRIHLKDLRVTTGDHVPVLSVGEVDASYRLLSWMGGTIALDEVRLIDPSLHIVQQTNGTSNLDPILRSRRKKKRPDSSSSVSVVIARGVLRNALVEVVQHQPDGGRSIITVSNLNLTLQGLGNGTEGQLQSSAQVASLFWDSTSMSSPDGLTAQWTNDLHLGFDPEWKLSSIQGLVDLNVLHAVGFLERWRGSIVHLDADAFLLKHTLELRSAKIGLPPKEEAANEMTFQGRFDWSDAQALAGDLHLTTTALDLTALYDTFAKPPTVNTNAPEVRSSSSDQSAEVIPAPPRSEPEPVALPFHEFTVSWDVPRLRLHELELTAFHGQSVLNDGRLIMDPWRGFLNGQAFGLTTKIDMTVPGWKYEVAAKLDHIPIDPIMKTFSQALVGKINGELVLDTQFQGAGMTDASWRDNLEGYLLINVTNAQWRLAGTEGKARTKTLNRVLTVETVIQGAAHFLRLPALLDSPVEWINADLTVQKGTITLHELVLKATAFSAGATATIPMSVPLTNSPLRKIPVHFALERTVADGANLIPLGSPKETPYVPLPDFIYLKGTLGSAQPELKKTALAGLLLKSTAGLPGTMTSGAGQFLQGFGEILTGERSVTGTKKETSTAEDKGVVTQIFQLPGTTLQRAGNLIQEGSDVLGGPDANPLPDRPALGSPSP